MESKQRLLRLLVQRLPPFLRHYEGKHHQYVADFIEVLQYLDVTNIPTHHAFVAAASNYLRTYGEQRIGAWHPDYVKLPFFWFVSDFFDLANVLLGVKDHFHQFIQLQYDLLRGDDKVTGVFHLLDQGVPLTDRRWEDLQYRVYDYQIPLTADELHLVRLLYRVIPQLSLGELSFRTLEPVLQQEGANANQIRGLKDFTRWQGLFVTYLMNWPRLGVEEFNFNVKTPPDVELGNIIPDHLLRDSIMEESRFYTTWPSPKDENVFLGILRLPPGHESGLHGYLQQCQNDGRIRSYEVNRIIERINTYALSTYQPQEGYKQFATPEVWRHLEGLMDGKGRPLHSLSELTGGEDFIICEYPAGQPLPLTYDLIHLRTQLATYFPLSEQPPDFTGHDRAQLAALQETGVLVPYIVLRNLSKAVTTSTLHWLSLPLIPAPQLRTLLNFSLFAHLWRTTQGLTLHMRFPRTVEKTIRIPGWAPKRQGKVYGIVVARKPGWVTSKALDGTKQRWKTPALLRDFVEEISNR